MKRPDLEDGTPGAENVGRFARREEMIEELVAAYLDRLNAGESLDPDAILLEHPDVGVEVLADLETFVQVCGGTTGIPCLTIGDYTLRRRIGRGGMGVVYEAWQNSLGRSVALKVLPAGIAADTRVYSSPLTTFNAKLATVSAANIRTTLTRASGSRPMSARSTKSRDRSGR